MIVAPITDFDGARTAPVPADRLRASKRSAEALRERLLSYDPVPLYRSIDLVAGPYPTAYGLRDAAGWRVGPFCCITNRMFVVRVPSDEGVKTLVVSPTHHRGGGVRETPFFARLARSMGPMARVVDGALTRDHATVPEALAEVGVRPEEVDYVTYDHLHVQDLRPWLGPNGLFPKAKLLVTPEEWASANGLTPPQRDWYCPGGVEGIPEERLLFLRGDVEIGRGVAIVRTPGHTEGNVSIVVRTPEGLMVTSENGIGPDAYAPDRSAIPGVARWARRTGMDVVLNANTLERGLDQYLSMIVEKTIAGPSSRAPEFPNIVCSSELTPHWAYPGATPTFAFGPLAFGSAR